MKLISCILILLFCISSISAEETRDSINIKAMVQDQINSAKEVLRQERILLANAKQKQELIAEPEKINAITIDSSSSFISAATYLKIYLLTIAAFLAFLIIAYSRHRKRSSNGETKKLKNNIKLLRKEVPVQSLKDNLSNVRKHITFSESLKDTPEDITSIAKENALSKGEILLAAKIKEKMFGTKKDPIDKKMNTNNFGLSSNKVIEEAENIISSKIDQKEIIEKAKKLNISREEVMLVSRLKKMISTNAA